MMSGRVEGSTDGLGDLAFALVGLGLAANFLENLYNEGFRAVLANCLTKRPVLGLCKGAGNVTLPAPFDRLLRRVSGANRKTDVGLGGGLTGYTVDHVHAI